MNAATRHHAGTRSVSDAQLELFIDAALTPEDASRVAQAIANSPADAARLEELRATDADLRAALLAPARPASSGRRWRVSPFIAAAALLVLAGLVVFIRAGGGGSAPSVAPAPKPAMIAIEPAAAPAYSPVRVVMSFPVVRRDPVANDKPKAAAGKSSAATASPPANVTANAMASAFGDASDAGIRRAVTAIHDATPEDRAAALTTLGQTLRSGSTAVRILDRLEPRDQVAVCSELALDSALRAVALQRLRDLSDNPEVGADARAAARALASAPGMKPWLRSYGLLESDAPKPASFESLHDFPALS